MLVQPLIHGSENCLIDTQDKCPRTDFRSGLLCKFTLRPSRDDWCNCCRNTRLLIVDFLFPIVSLVFCLCFGCSVSLHLLDWSTYQHVAKEPSFLIEDENSTISLVFCLAKLKMDDEMVSVIVGWTQSKSTVFHSELKRYESSPTYEAWIYVMALSGN